MNNYKVQPATFMDQVRKQLLEVKRNWVKLQLSGVKRNWVKLQLSGVKRNWVKLQLSGVKCNWIRIQLERSSVMLLTSVANYMFSSPLVA